MKKLTQLLISVATIYLVFINGLAAWAFIFTAFKVGDFKLLIFAPIFIIYVLIYIKAYFASFRAEKVNAWYWVAVVSYSLTIGFTTTGLFALIGLIGYIIFGVTLPKNK